MSLLDNKTEIVMKNVLKALLVGCVGVACGGLAAADELPYKEGPVAVVTGIKIKEGKFFDYWNFLNTSWRQENEEAKKEGLVVSYKIFGAQPKTPADPDLYLVITYANYAAMDGLDEKLAVIDKKIWGTLKEAAKSDADRESIRTVLGSEVIRELDFKK
jgi:hypothetical protein